LFLWPTATRDEPSDVAGKLAHGGCSADVSTPLGLTGSLILLVAPQRDSPLAIWSRPHSGKAPPTARVLLSLGLPKAGSQVTRTLGVRRIVLLQPIQEFCERN